MIREEGATLESSVSNDKRFLYQLGLLVCIWVRADDGVAFFAMF